MRFANSASGEMSTPPASPPGGRCRHNGISPDQPPYARPPLHLRAVGLQASHRSICSTAYPGATLIAPMFLVAQSPRCQLNAIFSSVRPARIEQLPAVSATAAVTPRPKSKLNARVRRVFLSPLKAVAWRLLLFVIQQASHLQPQQFVEVLLIEPMRLRLSYEFLIHMEDRSPLQFLNGCLGNCCLSDPGILRCHTLSLQTPPPPPPPAIN